MKASVRVVCEDVSGAWRSRWRGRVPRIRDVPIAAGRSRAGRARSGRASPRPRIRRAHGVPAHGTERDRSTGSRPGRGARWVPSADSNCGSGWEMAGSARCSGRMIRGSIATSPSRSSSSPTRPIASWSDSSARPGRSRDSTIPISWPSMTPGLTRAVLGRLPARERSAPVVVSRPPSDGCRDRRADHPRPGRCTRPLPSHGRCAPRYQAGQCDH